MSCFRKFAVNTKKFINRHKNGLTKVVSAFMLLLLLPATTFAALTEEQQAQYDQLKKEISEINSTITALQAQEDTLARELAIFDAQAKALQLQINASQAKIDLLNSQIDQKNIAITEAEKNLSRQEEILKEYLRVIYMEGQTSQIELILTSNNFSDFVDKTQYLNTIQQSVSSAIDEINATKAQLEADKLSLETSKSEVLSLKAGQVSQKTALNLQITQRSTLIAQTNGNEAAYTKLRNNKASQAGILECLASGACDGDAGGDLLVVNTGNHLYQWDSRWGDSNYVEDGTNANSVYCSDCTYSNYGCLLTSLAMYYGESSPRVEANKHSFNNHGDMQENTGSSVSLGSIRSRLADGQKVILKLSMGGSYRHFVLAIGLRDDGTILINDPYKEPGTSYNFSRILYAEIPY